MEYFRVLTKISDEGMRSKFLTYDEMFQTETQYGTVVKTMNLNVETGVGNFYESHNYVILARSAKYKPHTRVTRLVKLDYGLINTHLGNMMKFNNEITIIKVKVLVGNPLPEDILSIGCDDFMLNHLMRKHRCEDDLVEWVKNENMLVDKYKPTDK